MIISLFLKRDIVEELEKEHSFSECAEYICFMERDSFLFESEWNVEMELSSYPGMVQGLVS